MNGYDMVSEFLNKFENDYKNSYILTNDIDKLITHFELIKKCINKQKCIQTIDKKRFKFFGDVEYIKYCSVCDNKLNPKLGQFCPKCGQKFY